MAAAVASTELIQVLEDDVEVLQVGRDICKLDDQDEAFFLLDLGDVVRKHEEWRRRMPRIRPFYAVKCNNHISVVRALAALGAGFDCASKNEVDQVMSVGVDASSIIFANPAKPASHIRHVAALGVHLMVFDNDIELRKMVTLDPEVKLVLRFQSAGQSAAVNLGKKFGCEPLLEGPRLLRRARELGADVVGVSFHVGWKCTEPTVYRRAIKLARGLFDAAVEIGYKMTLLNIGGGYPGHADSSIAGTASVINETLDELFPDSDVEVISEPGTFFVESAFTLYTQIHSKRVIRKEVVKHIMYYINDGGYGSFLGLTKFNVANPVPSPVHPTQGALTSSSVWGPTCSGVDRVNKTIVLPELDAEDWLQYRNMGAYSRVTATTFNDLPIARVHVVVDEKNWLALRDLLPMKPELFVSDSNPSVLRLGLVDDASTCQHAH